MLILFFNIHLNSAGIVWSDRVTWLYILVQYFFSPIQHIFHFLFQKIYLDDQDAGWDAGYIVFRLLFLFRSILATNSISSLTINK